MEQFSQNTYWTLAEDLKHLKGQERALRNQVGRRGEKKRKWDGTYAPGSELKRGKVPAPWEAPSDRLGQKGSFRGAEESATTSLWQAGERPAQTVVPLPCAPQPEPWVRWYRQGPSTDTQSLEDRPRERAAVGCAERAWRGWSVVWLQPGVSAEAQACHRTDEPLLSGAQRAGYHGRQPPPARTPGHRTPATASGAPDSADSGNPAAASGSHLGRLRGPSHRLGWHLHQPPSRQAPGADASELPMHRSRPETTAEPQGPRDLGSRAAISPCSCVSCVFTPPLPAL